MAIKRLIITHHAPDLDAIGAAWLLKRFDSQKYADAGFAFVNPGERIGEHQAQQLGSDLHHVTHVDTGLGKFDHHQPDRSDKNLCATSLVYEQLCSTQSGLKQDKALKKIVEFINEIDHFQEIHWPDPSHLRYEFMLHELIRGHELANPQNDESQLHFGLQCMDYAYHSVKQALLANEVIQNESIQFNLTQGACIGMLSTNDDTIKLAQKQGYLLAMRKDPKKKYIRIKVRPDAELDLKPLYQKLIEIDPSATWFYHPGGKMLLNGSSKHRNQVASELSLNKIIELITEVYD